ncbi:MULTISPECIES: cytochrome-c peroxidase [unclassified Janthinobacterium]|uniref:cytochrome-c peroxidase n=1 Tax=unclassified Janthinobacterium TaxID=2610881 RepID=UPI0008826FE9|nr:MULTISPECIES: cytochrome c peroxidase [unclassified Janthinobacterium]SDA83101.1 cytochrome c peroxidase [Janthinobacterium sp. 551a]SFB11027.1 cytochrome c peroxidase [Janthinobacterium sp. 344]
MKFASHLKQTTFAVAALLAGGAGLMTSMDGRASDAVSAGVACAADKGWDMACLRQLYAQPIARWPRPQVADGVTPAEMAPVSAMPQPQVAPAVVALGQRLFNDPRLSRSNAVACISCHSPAHSFADNKRASIGHDGRLGQRNAPGLLGVGQLRPLFWDGRAATLEEQALGPLQHPDEMAMDVPALAAKLAALDDYPAQFDAAFGPGAGVSLPRILTALADYQRTLLPPVTRFDTFLEGQRAQLNDRELLGLHLFRTKARCMTCHSGALLTDQQFHNLGLTYYGRKKYEDLGRYLVTGKDEDVGKFRTPGLRGVAQSGPWMHNGLFPQMVGLLNMYNAGMSRPVPQNAQQAADPKFPVTSPLLQRLQLTSEEIIALKSFLEVL